MGPNVGWDKPAPRAQSRQHTVAGKKLPATPWGQLPPQMRVLLITSSSRTGAKLAAALASDTAVEVALDEALDVAAGLEQLRDHAYDVVLVSHDATAFDVLEVIDAIRAGNGDDQPILVLGATADPSMATLCHEAGADAYLNVQQTTIRGLLWQIARARERQELLRENRRLRQAQQQRLESENVEATRLIEQQRALLLAVGYASEGGCETTHSVEFAAGDLTASVEMGSRDSSLGLLPHYRELLRTYVIMGTGNLASELERLVDALSAAEVASSQVLALHLRAVEEAVRGLGNRSARHVLNRADLLILEVLMRLAETYRRRGVDFAASDRHIGSPNSG